MRNSRHTTTRPAPRLPLETLKRQSTNENRPGRSSVWRCAISVGIAPSPKPSWPAATKLGSNGWYALNRPWNRTGGPVRKPRPCVVDGRCNTVCSISTSPAFDSGGRVVSLATSMRDGAGESLCSKCGNMRERSRALGSIILRPITPSAHPYTKILYFRE